MCKEIDFRNANATQSDSRYYLTKPFMDGTALSIAIDEHAAVTTDCPDCGTEVTLTVEHFIAIMGDGMNNIYSSRVLCQECGKKRGGESS